MAWNAKKHPGKGKEVEADMVINDWAKELLDWAKQANAWMKAQGYGGGPGGDDPPPDPPFD